MLRHASTSSHVVTNSYAQCARSFLTSAPSSAASPQSRPLHLVLLGAPGAGKGTQTEKLLRKFKLSSLIAGDLLREEVARKSDVGVRAAKVMKAGGLLDDATILDVIKPSLAQLDGKDWILVRATGRFEINNLKLPLNRTVFPALPNKLAIWTPFLPRKTILSTWWFIWTFRMKSCLSE